jgi:hypothetical protein
VSRRSRSCSRDFEMDLNIIRTALERNGWFVVIDYLVHKAEEEGNHQLASELDRAGQTLIADIEHLGGKPEFTR